MKCVIIESPFRGDNYKQTRAHEAYLEACIADSLSRGEAPFASHALYPRVLDDEDPAQREQGMQAGLTIGRRMDFTACYIDHGLSTGMLKGLVKAQEEYRPVEYRRLFNAGVHSPRYEGLPLETVLAARKVQEGAIGFRPVAWRGSGAALVCSGEDIVRVPASRGAMVWNPRRSDFLEGIWDVVDLDRLVEENR